MVYPIRLKPWMQRSWNKLSRKPCSAWHLGYTTSDILKKYIPLRSLRLSMALVSFQTSCKKLGFWCFAFECLTIYLPPHIVSSLPPTYKLLSLLTFFVLMEVEAQLLRVFLQNIFQEWVKRVVVRVADPHLSFGRVGTQKLHMYLNTQCTWYTQFAWSLRCSEAETSWAVNPAAHGT